MNLKGKKHPIDFMMQSCAMEVLHEAMGGRCSSSTGAGGLACWDLLPSSEHNLVQSQHLNIFFTASTQEMESLLIDFLYTFTSYRHFYNNIFMVTIHILTVSSKDIESDLDVN